MEKKILTLRKKYGFTQDAVAEVAGVSRQTVYNWENGSTTPDLEQASKISNLFNIGLSELADDSIDVICKTRSGSVLDNLVNTTCYLSLDEDYKDLKINDRTPVKILEISNDFIKIQFNHKNGIITKLIDINLIMSIKVILGDDN